MFTPLVRDGGWVLVPVRRASGGRRGIDYVCVRYELVDAETGRLEPAEAWTKAPAALADLDLPKVTGAVNGPRLRDLVTYKISTTRMLSDPFQLHQWVAKARAVETIGAGHFLVGGIDDQVATQRKPDSFYKEVANAYSAALAAGHHNPAAVIARANKVGVVRVQGWVREARKRGILPPAERSGRAG